MDDISSNSSNSGISGNISPNPPRSGSINDKNRSNGKLRNLALFKKHSVFEEYVHEIFNVKQCQVVTKLTYCSS